MEEGLRSDLWLSAGVRSKLQEICLPLFFQEIVQQLIENSTTFRDKTEFAQDKYIKKKKKKYEAIITILKPSTRILSIMYYAREPGKIKYALFPFKI